MALWTQALVVNVVDVARIALPEDGTVADGQSVVLADGEACIVEARVLKGYVELELVVGNDFGSTVDLVGHDAAFEGYIRDGVTANATLSGS